MPHDPDVSTTHVGCGVELRAALRLPPVRVTVVGGDARVRQRAVELLSRTPGLEVVGWADSVKALTAMDRSADLSLAVESGSAGERGPEPPAVRDPVRPRLSPRQQQVLAAYTSGNELLDVVARRLGMGPETLKTHLRRIRVKYEAVGRAAPTRRDLYVRALEDGLLAPPG